MALTTIDPALQNTQAQYTGFKNRIINGAMVIDQRNAGASVIPSTDSYTLDRWFISGYGTGLNSVSIQRLSSGVVSGFSNYLRMQAGSTSATNSFLSQSIETNNCYDLAGQSVTVSFWYRINTNFTNACTVLLGSSTSADTKIANSAGTTSSLGTLTNTSTWTKFTATVTVPSNALTVSVIIINGYNNVVNGANIDITGVQLEKGSTATSFDYRPYGTELSLCQRYYEVVTQGAQATCLLSGVLIGAANWLNLYYKQTKRATPTVALTATGLWNNQTPTIWPSIDQCSFNSGTSYFYNNGTINTPVLSISAEL